MIETIINVFKINIQMITQTFYQNVLKETLQWKKKRILKRNYVFFMIINLLFL